MTRLQKLRLAPYFFGGWLAVTLLQFIWLSPIPSVIATAAVAASLALLIQRFASRIGRDGSSILSLLIMLAPGLYVTSKLPNWSILMYGSAFLVVVTGFYSVLYGIERVRRHS